MNQNNDDRAEAREILDAMHQIQSDPELASEAIKNPESVLDRLALSGAVRHAVAFGLTAVVVGGHLKPGGWWCN